MLLEAWQEWWWWWKWWFICLVVSKDSKVVHFTSFIFIFFSIASCSKAVKFIKIQNYSPVNIEIKNNSIGVKILLGVGAVSLDVCQLAVFW